MPLCESELLIDLTLYRALAMGNPSLWALVASHLFLLSQIDCLTSKYGISCGQSPEAGTMKRVSDLLT